MPRSVDAPVHVNKTIYPQQIAFSFITARRQLIGAEIGGSTWFNYVSGFFMISLWVIYMLMVSLQVCPLTLT